LLLKNPKVFITPNRPASENISMSNNFKAKENTINLNIVFILGFFLGDGSAYIRIRDNVTGLLFIPKFEIKQKNTSSNFYLMELITNFLISKGVQASLRTDSYYVLSVIDQEKYKHEKHENN